MTLSGTGVHAFWDGPNSVGITNCCQTITHGVTTSSCTEQLYYTGSISFDGTYVLDNCNFSGGNAMSPGGTAFCAPLTCNQVNPHTFWSCAVNVPCSLMIDRQCTNFGPDCTGCPCCDEPQVVACGNFFATLRMNECFKNSSGAFMQSWNLTMWPSASILIDGRDIAICCPANSVPNAGGALGGQVFNTWSFTGLSAVTKGQVTPVPASWSLDAGSPASPRLFSLTHGWNSPPGFPGPLVQDFMTIGGSNLSVL